MTHVFRRFFKISQNKKARKSSISSKLELISLDERITPATFTVTNNGDSGLGSLRRAISDSNVTQESDTILFSLAPRTTITLLTTLPAIDSTATAGGTLTITGPGSDLLTISGKVNIFNISAGGDLAISGLKVSGGLTAFTNRGTLTVSSSIILDNTGGGIVNNSGIVNISNSTISGNTASSGGGIYNRGTLTVNNSTISGNTATAIFDGGGGIYNRGTLTVNNSTISGNTAINGGGILNSGTTTISNSTISGNSATAANYGGGGIQNNGTLTISSSTLSANAAPSYGGGIYNSGGSILNIGNTIIANSTGSTGGSDFSGSGPVNLIAGSKANNLITLEPVAWATKVTSAELNLGPLQDNLGPTKTMALLPGSVAINTGSPTISNAPPINGLDQRGFNRSLTTPSIGAYETAPIGPALNPTFGTPISTANGFTVQITNYDPAFTFNGTATASGIVSIDIFTGVVTVTGLATGTSSTATITTTRTGYNSGSGSVTGSSNPGLPALIPTFGTPTSTLDGFTVLITNYDAAFNYGGTATASGSVSINIFTGLVTVTGVAPGTSSTATITTTRTGYNSGSATVTGSSTIRPTANNPTFGTPISTANGFNVQITNYDPAFTYGGTATANGRVSINSSGFVTVTGVAPGTFSTATITVNRFGYNPGAGSITASSLNGPALNPTFGTPSSTTNGFTVQITNYDGINYIYGSSVSTGTVSINSNGLITVADIAPRIPSTVTITTNRNGYNSGFGTVTATSANGAALIPTFDRPVSTADGFIVQITNYDSAFTYAGTATANGTVLVDGSGFVTVTGVAPGTNCFATITTSRANYNPGSGTIAATSINGAALNSTFGVPSSTANGFTVQIANYDSANYTYSSFVFTGGVSINTTGLVTITGIAPSTSSTVFITTNRVGYNTGTGSIAGTSSIGAALNPTFGTPISTTNGFNVQITNYDAAFTYAGTATANGIVSINSTGLVAVTGVAFGASSTATITTTRIGYSSGSSQVTSSAGPNVQFAAGTDSGGGPVVMVRFTDGSSLSFFAYDPSYTGGVRVALGDLNGDGTNEVICGAGAGGGPNVRVFSVTPSRATMVASFFAFEPVFMGGVYVAAGNLDGNVSASGHGIDDLIVSAGPGGGPRVISFSGGSNYVNLSAQLCDYFVYAPTFRGGVSVAAGNVFGGVGSPDEIITGAGPGGGPHVRAFQLSNTNRPNSVLEYMAFDPDYRSGIYVSAGDISGDGIDDIFAGSNAQPNNPSMVNVHQSNGSNTLLLPFGQSAAGGARVGVARDSSNNEYMVVGSGPGVDRSLVQIYNRNLIVIDSLFVFPIDYNDGIFVSTTISS